MVILRNRPRCERDANDIVLKMSRKCLENESKACRDVLRCVEITIPLIIIVL